MISNSRKDLNISHENWINEEFWENWKSSREKMRIIEIISSIIISQRLRIWWEETDMNVRIKVLERYSFIFILMIIES